jgi:hypothetical protein
MTQVILNHEQTSTIRGTSGSVEIVDESGILVGYLNRKTLATPEEIAEAKRRLNSDGPWYTTAELLDHLKSLEQK